MLHTTIQTRLKSEIVKIERLFPAQNSLSWLKMNGTGPAWVVKNGNLHIFPIITVRETKESYSIISRCEGFRVILDVDCFVVRI